MKQYNESIKRIKKLKSFDVEILKAVNHLKNHDTKLAKIIDLIGPCTLKPKTKPFKSIVDAIISQQLSMFAAESIFNRFVEYYKPKTFPEPQDILDTDDEELRKLGISYAKIRSIKDLSSKVLSGDIKLNKIVKASDEEIISTLIKVKGIGRWTAHMFLIFSLGRMDVLPVEDLGIRKGIQKLYQLKKLPDAETIFKIAQKNNWHPYCSIASWYIWRSLELK